MGASFFGDTCGSSSAGLSVECYPKVSATRSRCPASLGTVLPRSSPRFPPSRRQRMRFLSLFAPNVREMCVAQIEFPFDPAPRFVLQHAPAIKLIDSLPLRIDQE